VNRRKWRFAVLGPVLSVALFFTPANGSASDPGGAGVPESIRPTAEDEGAVTCR